MQILVNGFVSGLTISVLALAFTAAYLPTRVFHIALGGVFALVPYVAWTLLAWGWTPPLVILIAVITGTLVSVACEYGNHWPLENKGGGLGAHLISSLGLYILFSQMIALAWGNETRVLRLGVDTQFTIGPVAVTTAQVISAGSCAALLIAFGLWLRFSDVGLTFRALADNPTEFSLRGYSVRSLRLIAFGISGLLCSLSALLLAYDTGFDPHNGLRTLLLAVVAMIVGGRLSLTGPIIGGVILGVMRTEVAWWLSARWQDAATFLLLVLFLLLCPNGLVGRTGRLEARA